jgi:hypothetical protein
VVRVVALGKGVNGSTLNRLVAVSARRAKCPLPVSRAICKAIGTLADLEVQERLLTHFAE